MVRNSELKRDLENLHHQLDLIQTVLMVTNPDSPLAAEAYEGLRRTVLQSLNATKVLHATLAQLDAVAASTDDVQYIRLKINELLAQSGVTKLISYEDRPDAFERIGSGSRFSVTKPAYVTTPEMPPVIVGVVESTDEPESVVPPSESATPEGEGGTSTPSPAMVEQPQEDSTTDSDGEGT